MVSCVQVWHLLAGAREGPLSDSFVRTPCWLFCLLGLGSFRFPGSLRALFYLQRGTCVECETFVEVFRFVLHHDRSHKRRKPTSLLGWWALYLGSAGLDGGPDPYVRFFTTLVPRGSNRSIRVLRAEALSTTAAAGGVRVLNLEALLLD